MLDDYNKVSIMSFEADRSLSFGIERFTQLALRIDRTLEKLHYDSQVYSHALSDSLPESLRLIPGIVAGITIVLLFAVGLLVSLITLKFNRGMQQLLSGVDKIANGGLKQPVKLAASDELEELAKTFNHMAEIR